jgi:hypothetical protein
MGVVDEIGSIHIQEDEPDFRVGNRLVSEIVKSFTESQLGLESEALLRILPAVITCLGMPSSESALMTAVKSANQHRRKKEFEKAEAILKWAWTTCAVIPSHNHRVLPEDLTELAAVALGELYRFALRDPDTA